MMNLFVFIQNEEFCIKSDECCIKNKEFYTKTDEICRGCRGWTVSSNVCYVMRGVGQHYPDPRAVSGYPLHSDAASYCQHENDNRVVAMPWADSKMRSEIACSSISPTSQGPLEDASTKNETSHFPRAWVGTTAGAQRGQAWMFYPRAWCAEAPSLCKSCTCTCTDPPCGAIFY